MTEFNADNEFGLPVPFLNQVVTLAIQYMHVERIWVFGSRAKGTHRKNSDVDLAFEFGNNREIPWAKFCAELDENGLVLVKIDCIDFLRCQAELRQEILTSGKIIYEKNCLSL